MSNYTIRNMTFDEVRDIAIKWAGEEGWNPGINDATPFFNADPKGFYVGLLDGEPIACKSAVAYDDHFGFMGFYIVKPEYRRKGYGYRLWKYALESLGTRNSGMDGVLSQQANYQKSGYKIAYRNIRYEGLAQLYPEDTHGIFHYTGKWFEELVRYDAGLFPAQRSRFLEYWVNQPFSTTLISMDNIKINGYGTIRKCMIGYKIGPLLGDNTDICRSLFMGLNNFVEEGSIIYFDTPEPNRAAVELAESSGMKYVFETARMYNRGEPKLDINKIFGITTFELG
jgi:GNAT superfamily N-acetyltransferase